MILRPAVIDTRLRYLRQVVRNLEIVRAVPREQYVSSFQWYWLGERGLQLAAETVFDVGTHILSGHFNESPADYEDVLERLRRHGAISEPVAGALRGLGGFRNVLVHTYLDIDEERVHLFLQQKLDVFLGFADDVEAFLKKATRT